LISHYAAQNSQGNPGYSTTDDRISPYEINEKYLSTMESIADSFLKHMLETEVKVILVVLALDDLIVCK